MLREQRSRITAFGGAKLSWTGVLAPCQPGTIKPACQRIAVGPSHSGGSAAVGPKRHGAASGKKGIGRAIVALILAAGAATRAADVNSVRYMGKWGFDLAAMNT